MRRVTVILALTFVSLIDVPPAGAQDSIGPKAGTWGAEATNTNTASLLRFRRPTSAWILGASAQYIRLDYETSGPGPTSSTDEFFSSQISFGIRTYRRPQERIRPFTTLSAIVGYRRDFQQGWSYGGAGDIGAAYFFSSHVSLGVAETISVVYQQLERDVGLGSIQRTKSIAAFSGFRLLGAVYF